MSELEIAAVAAVLAASLAAIFTSLIHTYFQMRSADVDSINDHIGEIRRIEEYAVAYWLVDPATNPDEELRLSTCLSGAMSASSHFNEVAGRIFGSSYAKYIDLDQRLYNTATGGMFQSAGRQIDTRRVIETMNICNELRALLRKRRRSIFWTK